MEKVKWLKMPSWHTATGESNNFRSIFPYRKHIIIVLNRIISINNLNKMTIACNRNSVRWDLRVKEV